jgi:hypothetical protein
VDASGLWSDSDFAGNTCDSIAFFFLETADVQREASVGHPNSAFLKPLME